MKTNKFFLLGCTILSLCFSNESHGQLKVTSSTGNVGLGTLTPISKLQVTGDAAIFTSQAGYPTSSAYIRCNSSFSFPSNPDYTWFGNDKTGLYHSGLDKMGISVGGYGKINIGANSTFFTNDAIGTIISSPLIKHTNNFSGPTNPDYTWWGNDKTGLYHSGLDKMGISVGGYGKINIGANSTFFTNDAIGTIISSPLIKHTNNFSGPTNPDYTWWGNDQTGMFHPAFNTISFSISGVEKLKIDPNGNIGIGINPGLTYKLNVNGNANFNGYGTYVGTWSWSDKRYKQNIQQIDGALDKILQITGTSYEFRRDEFKEINFMEGKSYGFIAQDLMKIIPEAVKIEENGYYSVNYIAVIPFLTEALKEQNDIIIDQNNELNNLTTKLENLEAQIKGCCQSGALSIGSHNYETKQNESVDPNLSVLFQNTPNPFTVSTEINYSIAPNAQKGALFIFDLQGNLLKTYDSLRAGNGKLSINGGEFSAGMYIYSLVVDGKEIDSKRMILTK